MYSTYVLNDGIYNQPRNNNKNKIKYANIDLLLPELWGIEVTKVHVEN